MQLSPFAVIHLLETLPSPDRRLDCEVARILAAPAEARLAAKSGLAGWDIVIKDIDGAEAVYLAAEAVPYSARYLDAAMDVLDAAMPEMAPAVVRKAVAAKVLASASDDPGALLGGGLARAILAQALRSALPDAAALPHAA